MALVFPVLQYVGFSGLIPNLEHISMSESCSNSAIFSHNLMNSLAWIFLTAHLAIDTQFCYII